MGIYYNPPPPPTGNAGGTPPEPHVPIGTQGSQPPRFKTAIMLAVVLASWPQDLEPRLARPNDQQNKIAPLTLTYGQQPPRFTVASRMAIAAGAWPPDLEPRLVIPNERQKKIAPLTLVYGNAPPPTSLSARLAASANAWLDPVVVAQSRGPVAATIPSVGQVPWTAPQRHIWTAWAPDVPPPASRPIAPLTLTYGDPPPLIGGSASTRLIAIPSWPADLEPRLGVPNNRQRSIAPLTLNYGSQPPPLGVSTATRQILLAAWPADLEPRLVSPNNRQQSIAPLTLVYGDPPPPSGSRLLAIGAWSEAPASPPRASCVAAFSVVSFTPYTAPPSLIWRAWADPPIPSQRLLGIAPLTLSYGDQPPRSAKRLGVDAWADVTLPVARLTQSAAILSPVLSFVPSRSLASVPWAAWAELPVRLPSLVRIAPLTLTYGQQPPRLGTSVPSRYLAALASWPLDLEPRLSASHNRPRTIASLTLPTGDRPPFVSLAARLPLVVLTWTETPARVRSPMPVAGILPALSFVPFVRAPQLIWTAWAERVVRPPIVARLAAWTLPVSGDIYRIPVEEYFAWQRPVTAFQTTPPASPSKGDRYIVSALATAAWAGHENAVAWFNGIGWKFDVPGEGWAVFNIADSTLYFLVAGVWTAY